MPKRKKQPRNAFYFYMVDRKKQLESEGYHFPGGLKDVATNVASDWDRLSLGERAHYEQLAKQVKGDEKYNLENKFTSHGESFAHVMERDALAKEHKLIMEDLVNDLTINSNFPENRNFIVIKTIHSCEYKEHFWPLEIAIAAFNLADGLQNVYWTLVDTKTIPLGYASLAKETSEETGLPQPGNRVFEEKHRDYKKIIMNIKRFVEKFLVDYGPKYILFAMDSEMKSAEGCVQWLYENAELNEDEGVSVKDFMDKLAFFKLPKLILKFAKIANSYNPEYKSNLVQFNDLERTAEDIISRGLYDYLDTITCVYHNEYNQEKMHTCCKNVILRRIYLILNEIVTGMQLERKDGHKIEMFKTAPKLSVPSSVVRPGDGDSQNPGSSSGSYLNAGVSTSFYRDNHTQSGHDHGGTTAGYASGEITITDPRRATIFMELDFPTLDNSGLGALWGNSNGRVGRGRGRGSGIGPIGGPFRSNGGRAGGRR